VRRRRERVTIAVAVIAIITAIVVVHPGHARATGISSVVDFATPGGDPWGTTFDNSGRVWVALPGCDPSPTCSPSAPPGRLALFDPNTQSWVVTVSLPPGYGQPLFVAVDGNGDVWFTMPSTNAIAMYNPATATVHQWPVPTPSAGPWDLAFDHQGKLWFTEHLVNKIASFDPTTQQFAEVSTPATNSLPYGIVVDAADNVWFTENNDAVAKIGEYANGTLTEYKIRNGSTAGSGLTPHLITLDGAGNPWWSEGWVSSIGTLNLAVAQPLTNTGVTEYHYTPSCGGCGSHTSGIAADGQGLIWVDDSLQNTFGSFPVGGGAFSFYASPGNHPHDGLNVDAQGRVWFDEEFSNRLAEAIPSSSSGTSTTSTSVGGSTSTSTSTVPVSGSVLGSDSFVRANQALWGTASDGQVWAGDANARTVFSIVSNTGRVTNTGSTSYSAVLGPAAANADVQVTGSLSAFVNSNFGAVLRYGDTNNWYKAFIDGSSLFIQKKVAGGTTMVGSVPFAALPGASYTIEFRAIGSTLTAKVWPSSSAPPPNWMVSGVDTSLTTGFTGIRFLTQNGTATITNYQATSL
jgi:streptogramin lyase